MTPNTIDLPAAPEPSQTLSQGELDRASLYLEQTKIMIIGAIRDVSEAQWKFKPGPDRWSIAEILDHIVAVQERVLGPAREKLATSPVASPHPDCRHVDDIIIYQIPNRLNKFPTPMQPSSDLGRTEAINRVMSNYAALNEYLEKAPGLRNHAIEAPPLKAISRGAYDMMDGYQWILAAAAHTERHTKQVLEVMADPGFPA